MKDRPKDKGWYWVLLKGFSTATYTWREEWVVLEYDHSWQINLDWVRQKGLSDMTTIVRFVGPLERPEVME